VFITFAQAIAGLALLYFGGECLVRGAAALALRIGVSQLAIGLTVVAFGTSVPELVVSVDAVLSGANDISVGNVIGSNIANMALILGIAALIRPVTVEAKVLRIDAPILIIVSLALVAVLANGETSRVEGLLLLAGLVAYTLFTFWESRRESKSVQTEFSMAVHVSGSNKRNILVSLLLVIIGLLLLVGGGHILVVAAVKLATMLEVSQAVIGLTVVAVGTSLPELATSIVASMRGQGDIAVGNVIGSNIFNILGILAVTAVIHPLVLGAITWIDLGAMVAFAAIAAVFLLTGNRIRRLEGGVLLTGYILYTGWLFVG
jgi:cation:H+ antiporter